MAAVQLRLGDADTHVSHEVVPGLVDCRTWPPNIWTFSHCHIKFRNMVNGKTRENFEYSQLKVFLLGEVLPLVSFAHLSQLKHITSILIAAYSSIRPNCKNRKRRRSIFRLLSVFTLLNAPSAGINGSSSGALKISLLGDKRFIVY